VSAPAAAEASTTEEASYRLDGQVGFMLRQAYQRHAAIFAARFPDGLTPTQWAALAKLAELGPTSQNLLGRRTAMDVATIKGVVARLRERGLVATNADPDDRRRVVVTLTDAGRAAYARTAVTARQVSEETLAALKPRERETLLKLLAELR
jgi:MarR family transcriptional regulator, lower aerobic nicotinate degradation pathway regulator